MSHPETDADSAPIKSERPLGQRRELRLLAVALVLAMSTWFSTAAVLGQLTSAWELNSAAKSWLIIVLQIGFGQLKTRRTAVDDAADRRAVALAKGRHHEKFAVTVT